MIGENLTKKDWYRLGIILSIVIYLIVFIVISLNYIPKIQAINKLIESNVLVKYVKAEELNALKNYYAIWLIINPLWVGIVIFSILYKKCKTA
jgi:hypothetical protein